MNQHINLKFKSVLLSMTVISDYIISLTRLYGIIQKEKVAEIYNMENEDKITLIQIERMMENEQALLEKHHVHIDGNYFIHETIMVFDEFDLYMKQKAGKPYYIQNKTKHLKYLDQFYFEKTKEYQVLEDYVVRELTGGDRRSADAIGDRKSTR